MSTARLLAATFTAPSRGLAGAVARRSILAPLVAATAVSLTFAAVLVPRADFEGPALQEIERKPDADQMSPHDRDAAVAQARKVHTIATYGSALVEPAFRALAAALCIWVAFRVAMSRPSFRATLAVMSWATLPLALQAALALPALWRLPSIAPEHAPLILPSSLAALLPESAPVQLRGLAGALDLFSFWTIALASIGMAHVAQVSRRRSATIVVLVWAVFVLLVDVALPGFRRTA